MTEQRKQKQRIGLLGHPPHMNINPQQPAWEPLGRGASCNSACALMKMCLSSTYVGQWWLYASPDTPTCFDNMRLCEVEVICLSYSWSVLWVEYQEVPWDLKSQSCGFRQRKHCLQLHNCECLVYRTTVTACQRSDVVPGGVYLPSGLVLRILFSVLHQQTQVTRVFEGFFWTLQHMT